MMKLPQDPKTIVVVKLRAIGDAVIASPAVRALKMAYPRAAIVVVTTPVAAPIWQTHPFVDRVITYQKSFPANLWSAWRTVWSVRALAPDVVVNLHASSHSAWLSRWLGAPALVVHNHSPGTLHATVPVTAPRESKSAIERDLDAVRALGVEPTSADTEMWLDPHDVIRVDRWLAGVGLHREEEALVAINPGASRLTKRWPLERFTAAAHVLLEDPRVNIVVLGGPGEERLAHHVQRAVGPRSVAATGLTIREVGALLTRCRVLIGNDAGTHHVAAALRVPSVTLFGPELPREWHPYAEPRHVALTRRVHCVNCGLAACDRMECLYLIDPDEVVAAVRPFLRESGQKRQ